MSHMNLGLGDELADVHHPKARVNDFHFGQITRTTTFSTRFPVYDALYAYVQGN